MAIALLLYLSSASILLVIFSFGAGLIWGAIRHWPTLFKLPDSDWLNSFRFLQETFGDKGLFLYYVLIGLTFIAVSIIGFISINKGGIP